MHSKDTNKKSHITRRTLIGQKAYEKNDTCQLTVIRHEPQKESHDRLYASMGSGIPTHFHPFIGESTCTALPCSY
jgi:hypothetical protein